MPQRKPAAIAADDTDAIQALAGLGSWVLDPASRELQLSTQAQRLLGMPGRGPRKTQISRDEILKRVHHQDRSRVETCWRAALAGEDFDLEYRLAKGRGRPVWVWEKARFELDRHGRVTRAIGFIQNVSDRRKHQERMHTQANYDSLTGLPNLGLLTEHLRLAIAIGRRTGQQFAILFVDLDRFKQVNDELGHDLGDELLRQVAQRMKASLRDSDVVARRGGDEFIVLLDVIEHDSDAGLVALKVLEQLSRPFELDGRIAHIGASIGLTVFPADGADADTLFRNADMAMYQAKANGRETLCFFDAGMRKVAIEQRSLENELRAAIDHAELELHYQPIYRLDAPFPEAVEAQPYWQHPKLGLIGPERMLGNSGNARLLREIGRWTIEQTCRQQAHWQARGIELALATNVSERQIPEGISIEWLRRTISENNADPARLVLEIPEEVLIKDSPGTRRWLHEVAELGVELALNDFGTGYACFGLLHQFPIRRIKIDISPIATAPTDPHRLALLKSIVGLGRDMGLRLIATGIDDGDAVSKLRRLGFNAVQGGYFCRPLPGSAMSGLLERTALAAHAPSSGRVAAAQ